MSPLTFNIIRQSTQRTAARRGTLVMTQATSATAHANTNININANATTPVSSTTPSESANENRSRNGHDKELVKRVIETPGCFMHTIKGTVPHLTPDTLRLQGFGGVHVSIEQLLQDHQPGGFDKWPFTLSKFLNLQDMILLCDVRDPSRFVKVPVNSSRHVSIKTHKGVRQLTLEEYLEIIRAYQPDIVSTFAAQVADDVEASTAAATCTTRSGSGSVSDSESEAQGASPSSGPGLKRVQRSVDRSLKWLDQILLDRQGGDALAQDRALEEAKRRKMKLSRLSAEARESASLAQDTQQLDLLTEKTASTTRKPWTGVGVFAHVLGAHVEQERIRSAQETARREAVDGFIVDANPFQGASKETILSLLKVSIEHLPAEKPRMVYGLQTPEDVLRSIALGVDLFDTSYPSHLTEDGKASLYSFGSHKTVTSNNGTSITTMSGSDSTLGEATVAPTKRWINLWDDEHADKFVPILEGCECYACKGGRHTRAYINHLLKAHEMLATVLLMSHNMHQYSKFFSNVRQSIQDGTFEQHSTAFTEKFGTEPERTGEIHVAQAIVEAALSKRNRLDGNSNGNNNSSDSDGEQSAQSKEEKAESKRKVKEQERKERKEKNRMEGMQRKKEKQQQQQQVTAKEGLGEAMPRES